MIVLAALGHTALLIILVGVSWAIGRAAQVCGLPDDEPEA